MGGRRKGNDGSGIFDFIDKLEPHFTENNGLKFTCWTVKLCLSGWALGDPIPVIALHAITSAMQPVTGPVYVLLFGGINDVRYLHFQFHFLFYAWLDEFQSYCIVNSVRFILLNLRKRFDAILYSSTFSIILFYSFNCFIINLFINL